MESVQPQTLHIQRGTLAIVCLALSFESLRDAGPAPGVAPWEPALLALWAKGASATAKHAAAFALHVFARDLPADLGLPFERERALEEWSEEDRNAFLDWERDGAWTL